MTAQILPSVAAVENLTAAERAVLSLLIEKLYAEEGFSDVQVADLAPAVNGNVKSAKGVVGSLTKKGYVSPEHTDVNGSPRDFLHLTAAHRNLHPRWSAAEGKVEEKAPEQLDLPAAPETLEPVASATDVSFLLSAFATAAGDLVTHVKDNGALGEEQQASLRATVESLAALCGLSLRAASPVLKSGRVPAKTDVFHLGKQAATLRYQIKKAEGDAIPDPDRIARLREQLASKEEALTEARAALQTIEKVPVAEEKAEKPAKAEKASRAPRTAEPVDDFAAAAPAPEVASKKSAGRTRTVKTFGATA